MSLLNTILKSQGGRDRRATCEAIWAGRKPGELGTWTIGAGAVCGRKKKRKPAKRARRPHWGR